MQQLELWERECLSAAELARVVGEIRNLYWHIRNTRRGIHDARRRQVYRKIAVQKKRLLVAGVSKREVLDLLACCRSTECRSKSCFGCTHRTAQRAHDI
jgi:hypothetical protein